MTNEEIERLFKFTKFIKENANKINLDDFTTLTDILYLSIFKRTENENNNTEQNSKN